MDGNHFSDPFTNALIVLMSQVTRVKFWTHHKTLFNSCLLQGVSVPIEQLHPLKICPIIWMQMQYFIGRRDTTQLLRSYSKFATIMAFWKEPWCFSGQFSIIYQMPWKMHSLCLKDCTCRCASQGNIQSYMKRYIHAPISVLFLSK